MIRQLRKTAGVLALAACILGGVLAFPSEQHAVLASDGRIIEQAEDPSAPKGRVRLQALREKGCAGAIRVELAAAFPEGGFHYYTLEPGNGFTTTGELAAGTYRAVAMAGDDDDDSPANIDYVVTDDEIVVQEGAETVIVALEGSLSFVEQYENLVSFTAHDSGEPLSGEISRAQAQEYEEKIEEAGLEAQAQYEERDNGGLPETEDTQEDDEEYLQQPDVQDEDDGLITVPNEPEEEPAETIEPVPEGKEKTGWKIWAAGGAVAVLLCALTWFLMHLQPCRKEEKEKRK